MIKMPFLFNQAIVIVLLFVTTTSLSQAENEKNYIDNVINQWHKAAASADFNLYSSLMTKDAVFIGTDPTENWKGEEFLDFAKPYFDRGKAWSFSTLERNIYLHPMHNIAWFDELLDTQMGICRGSGTVVKNEGNWLIKHYVLSITIPNENVENVTILKSDFEKEFKEKIKN